MKLLKTVLITCFVAVVFTATPGFAQTTWTMVTGYPHDSFLTKNVRQFIDEVETKTDGALQIKLYANGSLVAHDKIKRAVRSGQAQVGAIRFAVYSNENVINGLDNIPALADTYKHAWELMQSEKPYYKEVFGAQGMRVLAYIAWPGQGFYTPNPVHSLEDLKGLTLRIYSTQTKQMGDALGMNAVILPFAEVPQAFATGLIESMWTSAQTGTDTQAWDYIEYFTYTGTMHNKNGIIVNAQALSALPEDIRNIVIEAGEHATKRGWRLSKKAEKMTIQALKEHGMAVSQAPEDVKARIQEIGAKMLNNWRQKADEKQESVVDKYLSSVGNVFD